jgi:hypothetical protein
MKRALLGILLLASVSCGDMVRQGTGSSYLIINSLEGAPGGDPGDFTGTLRSDVLTENSIFNDIGRVSFQLGLKDPGPAGSPTTPSPNNFITIDRYHVEFVRADGRNVPGVDVPYAFDSAFTVTVGESTTTAGFTLVRHQAKAEAPLAALARSALIISTIARVTFYGHDQTGREVIATGQIGVSFGDFADPD